MSAIHELSNIATLPEFDLFAVPPTQISVERTVETEFRPINPVKFGNPIEFNVITSSDQYVLLNETYLRLQLQIKQEKIGGSGSISATDYDEIVPCNYLLHSMIEGIHLSLGNKSFNPTPKTYPYRAYFETLLGYSDDAKKSHLSSAFWYEDEADRKVAIKPSSSQLKTGKKIDLMGRLHLDFTHQHRAILGGTPLRLKIELNPSKFFLKNGTSFEASVDITYAGLFVTTQRVTSFLMDGHRKALSMATAKYPITRSEVRVLTLPKDSLDSIHDHITTQNGILPRRMFLAMVSNAAFNGSFSHDIFEFKHYNVNYLALHVNGQLVPSIPYTPDFENGLCAREYLALYRALNQNGTDVYFKLKLNDFISGKTIIPFNISPDLSSGCGIAGHVSPLKEGVMRLYLRFATKLPETINILLFMEYDSLIEIDELRNASSNFN